MTKFNEEIASCFGFERGLYDYMIHLKCELKKDSYLEKMKLHSETNSITVSCFVSLTTSDVLCLMIYVTWILDKISLNVCIFFLFALNN